MVCVCVCMKMLMLKPSFCLQGYDNTESSVRKASVFCLVAIYSVIGEELKPHLAQLTGSKVSSHARQLKVHQKVHSVQPVYHPVLYLFVPSFGFSWSKFLYLVYFHCTWAS